MCHTVKTPRAISLHRTGKAVLKHHLRNHHRNVGLRRAKEYGRKSQLHPGPADRGQEEGHPVVISRANRLGRLQLRAHKQSNGPGKAILPDTGSALPDPIRVAAVRTFIRNMTAMSPLHKAPSTRFRTEPFLLSYGDWKAGADLRRAVRAVWFRVRRHGPL